MKNNYLSFSNTVRGLGRLALPIVYLASAGVSYLFAGEKSNKTGEVSNSSSYVTEADLRKMDRSALLKVLNEASKLAKSLEEETKAFSLSVEKFREETRRDTEKKYDEIDGKVKKAKKDLEEIKKDLEKPKYPSQAPVVEQNFEINPSPFIS